MVTHASLHKYETGVMLPPGDVLIAYPNNPEAR